MAVSDDKIALGYVQAFLCHGGGHKQVDIATTKLVQDFPLLRLIKAEVAMTTSGGSGMLAPNKGTHATS